MVEAVIQEVLAEYPETLIYDIGDVVIYIPQSKGYILQLSFPASLAGKWILVLAPKSEGVYPKLETVGKRLAFNFSESELLKYTFSSKAKLLRRDYVPRLFADMIGEIWYED